MAMISGPFNSVNRDRLYGAEWFGGYFSDFIGNGVYPNPSTNFQVMANNDMTITVSKGKGYINGVKCEDKFNYIANIDVADGVLNRIDRIVLRLETTLDRDIKVIVKKGTFASSPVAPTLQRDADAYEIALADITINKGTTTIDQSNIKDLRLSKELCGVVHGVVEQINTETLFIEYEKWMQNKKNDMNNWLYSNQAEFETEFYDWFTSLQAIFDASAQGNLLNEINKIDKKTMQNRTEISDVKVKLSENNVINFLNKTGIGFYDLFDSLNYIDDFMTTANVDIVANNVKFIDTKLLKMKNETFENFNNLELNIYDSGRITMDAMANSINNKLKVLVTPGSIAPGDRFYYKGEVYTVSSIAEGM